MFIATANSRDTIPAPLLDRMEIIELNGYTLEEKAAIGAKHVLPRLLTEHGLTSDDILVPDQTLAAVCELYTREPGRLRISFWFAAGETCVILVLNAGVRSLERRLAAICRHVAVDIVEHRDRKQSTTEVLNH